ncbi:MAG: hypothetical protein Q7K34_02535 [archaeon]|nr:hypothetical protein [archaeon]
MKPLSKKICEILKNFEKSIFVKVKTVKILLDPHKKQKVKDLIDLLEKSKKRFRPHLVVFWDYKAKVLDSLNNETSLLVNLPEFNPPSIQTTAGELQTIYRSQDDYVGYSHLIHIVAIFDVIIKIVNPGHLDKFLKKLGIKDKEIAEVWLARQTRHCHIHNNSKANKSWIKAYMNAKNNQTSITKGIEIKNVFNSPSFLQQIEDWQDLIIKISYTIYQSI